MGGRLELESVEGKGSEFYFTVTLPYGDQKPEPVSKGRTDMLKNARFLLVEDNELNAEIAIELLKMQGAQVSLATDGRQAVDMFSASGRGEFQAILMDIQMPVMDGLEATRAIRALDRPDARTIPIVAITAKSFQEDMDSAKYSGMDDFVTKPLSVEYLYALLRKRLDRNG
jgi:CheY-like chemotaxis protein